MGKRLTAVKLASYIANSNSLDEKIIFQEFLERHPKIKYYVGKLLNENDALSGSLLQEGHEKLAEEFFKSLKSEPYRIGHRTRNYNPRQLRLSDY